MKEMVFTGDFSADVIVYRLHNINFSFVDILKISIFTAFQLFHFYKKINLKSPTQNLSLPLFLSYFFSFLTQVLVWIISTFLLIPF